MVLFVFTCVYLFSLCFLLWVTRHRRTLYAFAKASCSGLFVVSSVFAFLFGAGQRVLYFVLCLFGLVLCMAGDILLGLANRTKKVRARPFVLGAVTFALAHVLFCILFYSKAGFAWFDLVLPLMLVGAIYLLEKRGSVRLKKMRFPAYIYSFLIGLMTSKAVEIAVLGLPQMLPGLLMAGGATLFLVSDIVLLFLYFGTNRQKWHRYANLITYYVGVYIISLTTYWM